MVFLLNASKLNSFQVMILKYKLTYPSGTATAYLINSFHTPKGAKLAKYVSSMNEADAVFIYVLIAYVSIIYGLFRLFFIWLSSYMIHNFITVCMQETSLGTFQILSW